MSEEAFVNKVTNYFSVRACNLTRANVVIVRTVWHGKHKAKRSISQ